MMWNQQTTAAESGSGGSGRQILTLRVGADVYAVDLLEVSELRRWQGAVRVPHARLCVRGVMNVRGSIVPVIELRQRLGMAAGDYGRTSVVVLLSVTANGKDRILGLLVDGVEDVVEVDNGGIRPPPGQEDASDIVAGMVTLGERRGVLLSTEVLVRDALPAKPSDDAAEGQ